MFYVEGAARVRDNPRQARSHDALQDRRPFNYFETLDAEVFAEIITNVIMTAAES
jgi:hypothetical protein